MSGSGILDAVEDAAGVDRSGWSGVARSAKLVELLEARKRLDALIVTVTGEWDRHKSWALDGAISPVSWLAHRVPITRQDASVLVRTARHVAKHDKTAKALDAGDVSVAHAQIIARAVRHRESLYPEHEDVILDTARALAPAEFREVMQHWRACADAVLDHQDARDHLDGNYLDIAKTFGSVGHLDGRFDPISTATLLKKLDALEPPDPTDAPVRRSVAQRRADALMRLVHGDQAPQINLDVLIDVDTLAGRAPIDLSFGCCDIQGFGPISHALARTLACDAAIGRVLMRGKSEILDLGRRTRLITPAQRRALQIRDRTCQEQGCDLPAIYCDGHHITHWTQHGHTNLENLEFRCRRHHLLQHQRDLQAAMAKRRE
jgi:hypothetical protein